MTLAHIPRNLASVAVLCTAIGGCIHIKTDPIKIEPISIEITVNHRIQRELDEFFADIDRASETVEYKPLEPTKETP